MQFFYKSEKSVGRESTEVSDEVHIQEEDVFQNIWSQRCFIWANILSGEEYFVTSSHKSHATFGNTNIEITITANHIRAYLIELIAGLILSSFHQDKISKTHPHKI